MNSYLLSNIVKKFNKTRKPECIVKTIENNDKFLKVKFTGTTASYSCCFDEHFNDFRFLLNDESNIEIRIEDIKRRNLYDFLVIYKILKKTKKEV